MAKPLEFFFDYISPFSYLADTQLPALLERTGAGIVYKPILLGGIFKASNNTPPPAIPAKFKSTPSTRCDGGAFGAPTFFVGDAMFWGNDRMHFIEAALK